MKYVIYIDIFFSINFIMDFIIISASKRFIKPQTTSISCLFVAMSGAVLSVILMMIGDAGFLSFILKYVLVAVIMNIITFRTKKPGIIVKGTIIIYGVTFILGGIMNVLYYHTYVGVLIERTIKGFFLGNLSFFRFVGISLIAYVIMQIILDLFEKRKNGNELHIYNIKIVYGETEEKIKGIYDTGNTLKEPVEGEIIHVVSASVGKRLKDRDVVKSKLRLVPYNSVSGNGLLISIVVDKMVIEDEYDNLVKEIINPRIGLSNREVSGNGEFQIILNRDLYL